MERQSISLIAFSVVFGVLIGGIGLLSAFYAQGYFTAKTPKESVPVSGMDALQNYNCRQSETKQIILGGIEDYFDPAGDEPSAQSDHLLDFLANLDPPEQRPKPYDDRIQNRYFSDEFDMPPQTFHGIIVIRMEELSGLKNDSLAIGYPTPSNPFIVYEYGHSKQISQIYTSPEWQVSGTLFQASLGKLKTVTPKKEKTLLDVIRHMTDGMGPFQVTVNDDTVVDFVGFALCLEPDEKKGTVFSPKLALETNLFSDLGPEYTVLMAAPIDDKICDAGGCLPCSEQRPIACVRDENYPAPTHFKEYHKFLWTGGDIAFTPARAGSSFETEDDVNEFCAAQFGPKWRSLSRHDGAWGGKLIGKGTFPTNYPNVWVSFKDQPHNNCWKLRPDYEVSGDEVLNDG